MNIILPSLIASDLLNLQKTIEKLDPYCAGYHLDIMDFHFVPNLTLGPDFINQIRKVTKKTINIHLMVDYPEKYINLFTLNSNDIISVHMEAISNLSIIELIKKIEAKNLIASLAISPKTPIKEAENLILNHDINNILLMSVHPGFSGQKFILSSLEKLKELNNFRIKKNLNFKITVDGGVNLNNIEQLLKYGANKLVMASAIFKTSKNYIDSIKEINELIKKIIY